MCPLPTHLCVGNQDNQVIPAGGIFCASLLGILSVLVVILPLLFFIEGHPLLLLPPCAVSDCRQCKLIPNAWSIKAPTKKSIIMDWKISVADANPNN